MLGDYMISIHKLTKNLFFFQALWTYASSILHCYIVHLVRVIEAFWPRDTTTLIAHTIYFGDPETMVKVLGWWRWGIGLTLMVRKLVRIAFALIVIRLPFILLAFILMPDVCYVHFPFALTLEGHIS
jgi:hypothetical protein